MAGQITCCYIAKEHSRASFDYDRIGTYAEYLAEMRLSQQTKNAVSVLAFCARTPEKTYTVAEVAAGCEITEYNAFKLVPLLVRTGFLNTIRGRNGGVCLARPAEEISIGSVVRATEERLQDTGGKTTKKKPTFDDMVDDAFLAFIEILDRSTIAELADGKTKSDKTPAKKPRKAQRSTAKAT